MKTLESKAKRFLPLTETTYMILVALTRPRHGYGIMQDVAEFSGGRVQLGPGTLYGALTNLLRLGLLTRSGETEAGDERRKVYTLTPLGREVALQESARITDLSSLARSTMKKLGGEP
jgi:DNA-binding PadR family transcriptional regulator